MNIESIREYCLSLPLATEDFPFDETTLVFRIMGKIFACLDLERPEWVTMKCNADYALEAFFHQPRKEPCSLFRLSGPGLPWQAC